MGDEELLKKEHETEPKETYITKYEDGVYSIYSSKYGVEVLADGERLKVKSHELIFRNRVTGLCGDMNGEKTSDLKSGRQCVLSHSQLTGFSYMLEDGKCRGIPEEKKTELRQEERRCIKDEVKPTKVHEIFGQHLGQKSPYFDTFFLGLNVPFPEFGSEHTARRTPMGREVESNKLLGGDDIISGNFGVVHLDEGLAFE